MSQLHDDQFERRSLSAGMGANLLMGAAGVTAAHLSNSDALMVDGLFSAVNFASAIIAGRIARSVNRKPDQKRPFGYEANESIYVLFRSMVLVGIMSFAGFNALDKIITYARGGEVPELILGPITVYAILMVAICFSLAAWHHHNLKKTGHRSDILKTERTAAMVDGGLSAGAGGALVGITMLRGTALDGIVPIADAIVVLGLAVLMVARPAGLFRRSLKEVGGGSIDEATTEEVRGRIERTIEKLPCELLQVAVTKLGRTHFVVSYIKPTGSVVAEDLDALRGALHESCEDLFPATRSEVVFTAEAPFD